MIIAGLQVIIAICNYSFDATPASDANATNQSSLPSKEASSELPPADASSNQTSVLLTRRGSTDGADDVEMAPGSGDNYGSPSKIGR